MSHRYKYANGASSSPPQQGGTLHPAQPPNFAHEDEDWEIINPSDYERPKRPHCGMSASGSFKIGRGPNKREIFSFNVSTGSNCRKCGAVTQDKERESRRRESQGSKREDDEETVVGEEEMFDSRTELLGEKGLAKKD